MSEKQSKLLAYVIFSPDAEAQCIAFASGPAKARAMHSQTPWLCEFDYTEIKARREPRADQWAGAEPELLDGSGSRSATMMHQLGWRCIDEPSCEWCGFGQWDGVPESRVLEREEFDHQEICEHCYQDELAKA